MKSLKTLFFRKALRLLKLEKRKYPVLPLASTPAQRPISFVVIHFSDDYFHNILKSECINNQFNELITIDNPGNLFHQNLTEAMWSGISKAKNSLIAVVHEDVLLPDGWQLRFETNLALLEENDPNWGVLGSVGWTENDQMVGHCSDPSRYVNSFKGENFIRVARLDEQILIFHRDRPVPLDLDLPNIHHIGRDLALTASQKGLMTYAIDAPTIHEYADKDGHIIHTKRDSPKIVERETLRSRAAWNCSSEYISHKWPHLTIKAYTLSNLAMPVMDGFIRDQLDRPIILLARGGGGSRLLTTLCRDLEVFLGNTLNQSGDCVEIALPIYQGIIDKHHGRTDWQKQRILPRLWISAANMLVQAKYSAGLWGFKLPESTLLLAELSAAFPKARFLHLVRDPLTTCLRRTHMTARLDNCVGQISLPLAYEHAKRPRENILEDTPAEHMAYTTLHQLDMINNQFSNTGPELYKQIRFEDLVASPTDCVEDVRKWLGIERVNYTIEKSIDFNRIENPDVVYPLEIQEKLRGILRPIRTAYGYIPE